MLNIQFSKLQKDILKIFGKNSFAKNFYWTGGTLLAYRYLHHRTSVDLDFFSDNLFTDDQYLMYFNWLKRKIKARKITLTLQQNRRLYLIERGEEVMKLELVYFPFPAIERRILLPEFSIKVDSLTDIIVNKTLSVYQRQEPKDVFDLYCYLTNSPKYNLQKLIKLVERKFGVAIEPTMLIVKINELAGYLDSISPLLLFPQKNLVKRVKRFFQDIFNNLAKKQIK